jgi:hypothetical protein
MTSKDYLRHHLTLLLAQYGEPSVLEGLAPLIGQSPKELHDRLADVHKIGHARQKKPKGQVKSGSSVESLIAENPEKAELLRKIQARFVARTFLPELKDVRRFLDRHGQPSTSVKKRDDAFARIARQLVGLSKAELEAVASESMSSGYSSLGLISDQILGRR